MRRISISPLVVAATLLLRGPAPAQDSVAPDNILLPVDSIERLLSLHPLDVRARKDTRWEGDRTQRVMLALSDNTGMEVKWAKSAAGGSAFNNQPRYELATYRFQKLFLDEPDYVVPPTVIRVVPLDWYRQFEEGVAPTFSGNSSVLVVLQYWLSDVTNKDVYDRGRIQSDTAYARHWGNLNLLTHLIRHNDANTGNILMSIHPSRPRLFSVDNGVAFGRDESDRGTRWRTLHTDRLPRATVERLRKIRLEELERALGVVAQFEERGGQLVPVEPTANLGPSSGVRRHDGVIQFGLEKREIGALHRRLTQLLQRVDRGRIQTF
jgi:hypothetical protein